MADRARTPLTEIAFTPSVKAVQDTLGSRARMQRLEASSRWSDVITADLAAFIATRVSFYLGTASAAGRPYIQHRGGPAGFLRVIDTRHIALPDFPGNQQYITLGNLAENPQAFVFLMDYPTKTRIKLWGKAWAEDLTSAARRIVFRVEAWDRNCRQHIPDLGPPDG